MNHKERKETVIMAGGGDVKTGRFGKTERKHKHWKHNTKRTKAQKPKRPYQGKHW